MKIQPTKCCIPKRKKINEIIKALNPLQQIEIQESGNNFSVVYSDNNVMITVPEQDGDYYTDVFPSGYTEELLDIVDANNSPAQRYFLTKTV